jgi:CRP/FNR family transcriptional regulator, cyclic AMP receptor protein
MSTISELFTKLRAKEFAPGATLIKEGAKRAKLYILESGELSVHRGGVEVATISESGTLVGEMSVLLETTPSATVKARTPVTAYLVSDPIGQLINDPALLLHLARMLATRLSQTTAFLAKSRRQIEARKDLAILGKMFTILGE